MAELTDRQREMYQTTLEMTKQEIEEIDADIERELAAVKERITQLNHEKEAVRQVYEGACLRLNVPSDLEDDEAGEEEEE